MGNLAYILTERLYMKKPVANKTKKEKSLEKPKKDVITKPATSKVKSLSEVKVKTTSKVIEKVKKVNVVIERETQVYENDKLVSSKKEEVVKDVAGETVAEVESLNLDQKNMLLQKIEQKISLAPNKLNLSRFVDGVLVAVIVAQVVGLLYILLK